MARSMNAKSERIPMDPAKSEADRFCRIPPIGASGAALRVHALIGNRAHTREFRSILRDVRKLRDWMVEQGGFELATPRSVVFGKVSATLAEYLADRKAAVPERISSPEIRLSFLNLVAHSAPVLRPPDWLQRRSRAMCVAVRAGGWTADERKNLRRRSGNSGE